MWHMQIVRQLVLTVVQVNGSDLRSATHDQAVDVIRSATNPIRFLVQSLATPPGVCILRMPIVYSEAES